MLSTPESSGSLPGQSFQRGNPPSLYPTEETIQLSGEQNKLIAIDHVPVEKTDPSPCDLDLKEVRMRIVYHSEAKRIDIFSTGP